MAQKSKRRTSDRASASVENRVLPDDKLTIKQRMFCVEYVKLGCRNGTAAARGAGYSGSDNALAVAASTLLRNPKIKAYLEKLFESYAMGAQEVLYHLAQIARGDIDDVLDSYGNPDIQKARATGATGLIKRWGSKTITSEDNDISETKAELHDKLRALELIGKHLAMWKERVEIHDWRSQAIEDIRAGRVTFALLAEAFDGELATELFRAAGVPVSS